MARKPNVINVNIAAEVAAAGKVLGPVLVRLKKDTAKLDPAKLAPGAVADLLYELEQLTKQMAVLTAPFNDVVGPAIKAIEDHFIKTLAVGESTGVQGYAARVQVTESVVPTVEDWDKFYAHIKRTGAFELLNRAPNRKAIGERWDLKKQVPGVGKFIAKRVSCTKLAGKVR